MTTITGRSHKPVIIDKEKLAGSFTLASQALAAAAEAIAEAAKAMSDASRRAGRIDPVEALDVITSSTQIVMGVEKLLVGGIGADVINQDASDGKGQHGLIGQTDPTVESPNHGNNAGVDSTDTRAILSESSERNDPDTLSTTTNAPQNAVFSPPSPASEPELNNKLDEPPASETDSSEDGATSTQPSEEIQPSEPEAEVSKVLNAMKSYPSIPAGRNYINLEQESDALAFVAYMALQVKSAIYLLPSQLMDTCSSLLKYLSRKNVYQISTYHQCQDIFAAIGASPQPDSYHILVESSLMWPFKNLLPECIVHWGRPAKGNNNVLNNIRSSLPAVARVCVVVVGEPAYDGRGHGVVSFSKVILNACFHPDSPWQILRRISAQPIPQVSSPPDTSQDSEARPSGVSGSPVSSGKRPKSQSIPPGNYYIVIEGNADIHIIPVIAYLALHSKRVMCHVPVEKSLNTCQSLIGLADVNTIVPTSMNDSSIESALARLQSYQSGVLLRSAAKEWNSFLSESSVDCLIYCGIPQCKLKKYCNECKNKVTHSYLILTKSEYTSIQSQLTTSQRIKEHPHIRPGDVTRPGSSLYNLHQRLLPHLPRSKLRRAPGLRI